jgi:glycosyltransferase involved in cell wall biosynthesis
MGIDVGLWSRDQSAPDLRNLRTGFRGVYLRGSESDAIKKFGVPDILHDNGMWQPFHIKLAALAKKNRINRVVSPRGMLEPWALKTKRVRKAVAWQLYQKGTLNSAALIHATSIMEAENLFRLNLTTPIEVIPNGIDCPELGRRLGENERVRKAIFVGRLTPKKGLLELIRAWSNSVVTGWELVIAGPDEKGFRSEVEAEVSRLRVSSITLLGPVYGEQKEALFAAADLFVFPSHSENFGLVVGEALSHGVPVLTTFGVPWEEVESKGCGWSVTADVPGITAGLRAALRTDRRTLWEMGERGRRWMIRDFDWNWIGQRFVRAYSRLLSS